MKDKTLLFFIALAFIVLSAANTYAGQVFVGNLSGKQEVPPNNSTGSGSCKFTLGVVDNNGTLECSYSLSSPSDT